MTAVAGLENFRDLGGVLTEDGVELRRGLLFRSDDVSRLDAAGLAGLRALGIGLICDLRSPAEHHKRRLAPAPDWPVRVVNVPLADPHAPRFGVRKIPGLLLRRGGEHRARALVAEYYEAMAFERPGQVGEAISHLARALPGAALFHCTAGKDRTGWLAALVQWTAGVGLETSIGEYLKSNAWIERRLDRAMPFARALTFGLATPGRARALALADAAYLRTVHAKILTRYASVPGYLRTACGVSGEEIQRLRGHLRGEA